MARRLATIGPRSLAVALVTAGVVTVGALTTAAGTRLVVGARPVSGRLLDGIATWWARRRAG